MGRIWAITRRTRLFHFFLPISPRVLSLMNCS
jgi:hypothetical protein